MTREDIVTEEGIDARFMSWLWNKDRQKYTLITLGHLELITEQLVREFVDAESKGRWIDKGTYMTETEEREMECPECGEEVTTTQGYYRYCPWCGEKIGG